MELTVFVVNGYDTVVRRYEFMSSYEKKTMPYTAQKNWGKAGIQKGYLYPNEGTKDATRVYIWSIVDDCDPENCPLVDDCPYKDRKINKCSVQSRYLKVVFRVASGKIGNMMDEDVMLMIGLELIPLYNQLFKLKVQDQAIKSSVYTDKDGKFRVNPTYKEIREVMKHIRQIWKEVEKISKQGREVKNPDAIGDNAFIEALSHDVDNEQYFDQAEIDPAIYEQGTGVDDGEEERPKKSDRRKRAARNKKPMTKKTKEKISRRKKKLNGNRSDKYVTPYTGRKGFPLPKREDGTFMSKEEIEQSLSEVEDESGED